MELLLLGHLQPTLIRRTMIAILAFSPGVLAVPGIISSHRSALGLPGGGGDPGKWFTFWLILIAVGVPAAIVLGVFYGTRIPEPPSHQPEVHRCEVIGAYTKEVSYRSRRKFRHRTDHHVVIYDHTRHMRDDIVVAHPSAFVIGDTMNIRFCEYCWCWDHFDLSGPCKE